MENITVTVTGSGSATSKESQLVAQELADSAAVTDAQEKMTAALAQYPGYVEGTCAIPVPFTANASLAQVLDICYNGGDFTVTAVGSGAGSSTVSAAAAQQDADAAAAADLQTKMAAALGASQVARRSGVP